MGRMGWVIVVFLICVLWVPGEGRAEESAEGIGEEVGLVQEAQRQRPTKKSRFWPLRPGVAIKSGGGLYRSVPCGCVDRGLFTSQLVGRLHFGWSVAAEADLRFGSMLLGGRFPSQGWALGARVAFWEPGQRWWDGFYLRAGFRRWSVMGMRADGTPGAYGGLNWEVKLFPHFYVEADFMMGRTFVEMPHWYFTGLLGVSTRL